MAVSLTKGQKVSLNKEKAGLDKIIIGLGWDAKPASEKKGFLSAIFSAGGADIDCDASAILLKDDKVVSAQDVIYFGNLKHRSGAVEHLGDNLTGDGDGDDEQIIIKLSSVPADYNKIIFVVNIYSAVSRKQHFGMIQNAFIRLVDSRDNTEVLRFNLTDDYSNMTAMIFGEVYRNDGEWKFNALGQGTQDPGLKELISRFS